jgi:hypothetical protein
MKRTGQPALAGIGAGEPADSRLHDNGATRTQDCDIGAGGWMLPHLGVHRGREEHRAPGGEQCVREQIVGQALRGLGEQVGGGRCDDDEVGLAAEADVRHLVGAGPDVGADRLAGQRRPGGLADECERRRGGHDPHPVPRLGQQSQQLTGLVGGDPARHAEDDRRFVLPIPGVLVGHAET